MIFYLTVRITRKQEVSEATTKQESLKNILSKHNTHIRTLHRDSTEKEQELHRVLFFLFQRKKNYQLQDFSYNRENEIAQYTTNYDNHHHINHSTSVTKSSTKKQHCHVRSSKMHSY